MPQLGAAVALAHTATDRMGIATLLYRQWFNPVVDDASALPAGIPLAGLYRAAHPGSRIRLSSGSVSVVARYDAIRAGSIAHASDQGTGAARSRPVTVAVNSASLSGRGSSTRCSCS